MQVAQVMSNAFVGLHDLFIIGPILLKFGIITHFNPKAIQDKFQMATTKGSACQVNRPELLTISSSLRTNALSRYTNGRSRTRLHSRFYLNS